jgi:hypothetical protein
MIKWIWRLLIIGIVGTIGVAGFQAHQKGYFNLPNMPEGAYAFSTKNGLRGIVLNAEVSKPIVDMPKFFRRLNLANPDRIYLGVTSDVAPWFKDAWSICSSPSEDERVGYQQSLPVELQTELANARFDAVCRIDVDGKEVLRGLLYSVPRL